LGEGQESADFTVKRLELCGEVFHSHFISSASFGTGGHSGCAAISFSPSKILMRPV
jgi:hypothetical protein